MRGSRQAPPWMRLHCVQILVGSDRKGAGLNGSRWWAGCLHDPDGGGGDFGGIAGEMDVVGLERLSGGCVGDGVFGLGIRFRGCHGGIGEGDFYVAAWMWMVY